MGQGAKVDDGFGLLVARDSLHTLDGQRDQSHHLLQVEDVELPEPGELDSSTLEEPEIWGCGRPTTPDIGDLDYHYLTLFETARYTLTGTFPDYLSFDAISRATPLDTVKAGLSDLRTFEAIRVNPLMGDFGGRGSVGIWHFT